MEKINIIKVREKYHDNNPVIEAYMDGWNDAGNATRKEINSVLAEVHKQIRHGLIINANIVYDMFEKLLQEI